MPTLDKNNTQTCMQINQLGGAPLDEDDLAGRQILCPDVARLKGKPDLEIVAVPTATGLDLFGNISTAGFRPLVPATPKT